MTALKLKEAFRSDDINDLPIEHDIAWYEQKAVAVLLRFYIWECKGIRFRSGTAISPNVLESSCGKLRYKAD